MQESKEIKDDTEISLDVYRKNKIKSPNQSQTNTYAELTRKYNYHNTQTLAKCTNTGN